MVGAVVLHFSDLRKTIRMFLGLSRSRSIFSHPSILVTHIPQILTICWCAGSSHKKKGLEKMWRRQAMLRKFPSSSRESLVVSTRKFVVVFPYFMSLDCRLLFTCDFMEGSILLHFLFGSNKENQTVKIRWWSFFFSFSHPVPFPE